MEYIITVVRRTYQHPNGEFVFRTTLSNRRETYEVYHLLKSVLPLTYQLYVDRWEKIATDVTKEFL